MTDVVTDKLPAGYTIETSVTGASLLLKRNGLIVDSWPVSCPGPRGGSARDYLAERVRKYDREMSQLKEKALRA